MKSGTEIADAEAEAVDRKDADHADGRLPGEKKDIKEPLLCVPMPRQLPLRELPQREEHVAERQTPRRHGNPPTRMITLSREQVNNYHNGSKHHAAPR